MTIAMNPYNIVTGTGAVDENEQEFSNFGGTNDKEFEEEVTPSARDLPMRAPQSSRIRGDTILARPGLPDAWKALEGGAKKNAGDDEDEDGVLVENAKFTCFFPGCGSSHNTAEDLTKHVKLDH